mgnify:CR=1 FL=1
MEKDYYTLYLKYKIKYIKLKKLIGAGMFDSKPPVYKYEEDSKNIHTILKSIFEKKEVCQEIKKIIFASLDSKMQFALKIIMTTDCEKIIKNVNDEKDMMKLIDKALTIFIPLYTKFIVNRQDLTFEEMDKLFAISVDLLRQIFGFNMILTGSAKLLSRQIIPVREINAQTTHEIRSAIGKYVTVLIETYDEDKDEFTTNIASCISNNVSTLTSSRGTKISAIGCKIPATRQLFKLINSLNFASSSRGVSPRGVSPRSSSPDQIEKNRINNIDKKIATCNNYLGKVGNNQQAKQKLNNTKNQLLNAKKNKGASHNSLICSSPQSPKEQQSPKKGQQSSKPASPKKGKK